MGKHQREIMALGGMESERTPYVRWWFGRHVSDYDIRTRMKQRSNEANTETAQSSGHCSKSALPNLWKDRVAALRMIVLFSSRNIFDKSVWIPGPLAPTEMFDSFKWPSVPTLVPLWALTLLVPFMMLCIAVISYRRQDGPEDTS